MKNRKVVLSVEALLKKRRAKDMEAARSTGTKTKQVYKERWRTCSTCKHRWLDKYNKAECVKCHQPMTDGRKSGFRDTEGHWNVLDKADQRRDKLTNADAELDSLLHDRGRLQALWKKLDSDGDGSASLGEFRNFIK